MATPEEQTVSLSTLFSAAGMFGHDLADTLANNKKCAERFYALMSSRLNPEDPGEYKGLVAILATLEGQETGELVEETAAPDEAEAALQEKGIAFSDKLADVAAIVFGDARFTALVPEDTKSLHIAEAFRKKGHVALARLFTPR